MSKILGAFISIGGWIVLNLGIIHVFSLTKWDSSDYLLVGLYCLVTGVTILNIEKATHGQSSDKESTVPKS